MSYRPLNSFKPKTAPPLPTPNPPRVAQHSTSSNLARVSTKGKERASRQDEADWASEERQQRGYKRLNAFVPPPPPVEPAQANIAVTSKRTSRQSTTSDSAPLRKQAKRIIVTEEEQEEWDREARTAGEVGHALPRKRRADAGALKPLTSTSRRPHPDTLSRSNPSARHLPRSPPPAINKVDTAKPLNSMLKALPLRPAPPTASTSKGLQAPLAQTTRASVPMTTSNPDVKPLSSHSIKLFQARQVKLESSATTTTTKKLSNLPAPPPIIKLERQGDTPSANGAGGRGGGDSLLDDGRDDSTFSSPEKGGGKRKAGNYLPSGIAARAHSILTSTKTDYALWLHDISRKLNHATSNSMNTTTTKRDFSEMNRPNSPGGGGGGSAKRTGRNKDELENLLKPDLKLIVVDVIPSCDNDGDGSSSRGGERGGGGGTNVLAGHKTLLTRCRLDLSPASDGARSSSRSSIPRPGGRVREVEEPVELDLTGTVLFSLHNHPNSSSSSSAQYRSTSFSSPQAKPKPATSKSNPESEKADEEEEREKTRTLFIPQGSLDLNVLRKGTEVWVFGSTERTGGGSRGMSEVELNGDRESWRISLDRDESFVAKEEEGERKPRGTAEEPETKEEEYRGPLEHSKEERRVEKWESEREKTRARVRKGLVVTKFGVLV